MDFGLDVVPSVNSEHKEFQGLRVEAFGAKGAR